MSTALLEQPLVFHHVPASRYLNYCGDCGRLSCENEETCPRCGGGVLEQVSQTGEIYSYTTVHESDGSFVLALVQLSSGPLVTARIVDVDGESRIGLPVRFTTRTEISAAGIFFAPHHTRKLALPK